MGWYGISILTSMFRISFMGWPPCPPLDPQLSSLLGDTESGISRLRCATLQCTACTSRHRRSNKAFVDYISAALRTPVTPFPPRGDAAYRQHAGGGPSHGHRQHAQKNLVKIARVVPEISSQTDRHTHIQLNSTQRALTDAGVEHLCARVCIAPHNITLRFK